MLCLLPQPGTQLVDHDGGGQRRSRTARKAAAPSLTSERWRTAAGRKTASGIPGCANVHRGIYTQALKTLALARPLQEAERQYVNSFCHLRFHAQDPIQEDHPPFPSEGARREDKKGEWK